MPSAGDFAPFVPYCFLACYVALLLSRPAWRDGFLVTAAGVAVGLALVYFHRGPWVAGLGVSSAIWVLAAPFFGRRTIHPAIALLVLYPFIASVVLLTIHESGGPVLDRYLLAADGSFGFQPGFLAASFLARHSFLKLICGVCYFGLPVALVSFFHTNSAKQVLFLVLVLGITAVPAYLIFPAVGAEAAFHYQFPAHPPTTNAGFGSAVAEPGVYHRNFMPSLHAAWGIALLLGAWRLGWPWRLGIIFYLTPMMWFTLARHYLCDLIVAVPWTLAVESAIRRHWAALVSYAAAAAAWLLLIRFGLPLMYATAWVPWTLAAATLAAPVLTSKKAVEGARRSDLPPAARSFQEQSHAKVEDP